MLRQLATFLLRRFAHALLILTLASLVAFTLGSIAPGDYFDDMRINSAISPETLAQLRSDYGLDRPAPERYLHWVRSIGRGQWGFSFAYNSPAGPILLSRCRNTLLLTCTATLLAWLAALSCGALSAMKEGSIADLLVTGMNASLLAIPEVVIALCALLFAVQTGLFPVGGLVSLGEPNGEMWAHIRDLVAHLALPAIVLAAGSIPLLLSHVRDALSDVLRSPFIEAAEASGIPPARILLRHAFPAAANPLISLFGTSIGMLISSSLLTEAVFGWPGLGQLMLEAIEARDFFLVMDSAMLSTAFFLVGGLIADVLLFSADPRIRAH